ncbi:MAG: MoaD family protein [Chloroflexi bacterium]|nr:MoaD family protein [Chloroflexota bacterium]
MAVEVRVPSLMRKIVNGEKTVQANGTTIGQLLEDLEKRYPGFKERILTPDNGLNQFVALYLNDEDIRFLKELNTIVEDGDVLLILPAVAGG